MPTATTRIYSRFTLKAFKMAMMAMITVPSQGYVIFSSYYYYYSLSPSLTIRLWRIEQFGARDSTTFSDWILLHAA
jgi:hypothetical protein